MATIKQTIVPHLWFDREAKEAALFYTAIFKNSVITSVTTIDDTPSGSVELVNFELLGQEFMAISAGPYFKFNEAISLVVKCDSQEEIDYYWERLAGDGGKAGSCGWLSDKYGLSWQIVPSMMDGFLQDDNRERKARVVRALLQMGKFDIATLYDAYSG